MSKEDSSVQVVLAKIRILQKRLTLTDSILAEKRTNLADQFPPKGICVYSYLLGDAYLLLRNINPSSTINGRSVDDCCLSTYESGMRNAALNLEIVDPLRLLCIYSWCNAVIIINNDHATARTVADATFNQASLHTNTIGKESIELLQRLRDDIILYQPKAGRESSGSTPVQAGFKPDERASVKMQKERPTSTKSSSEHTFGSDAPGGPDAQIIPPHRREAAQCALAVRRVVSLPVPLQLDVVPSAALILKALDKIFRTYVRGTALPGHLSGGNTVDFDGTTLTFRNFILHGPYISWKGFVHFLFDFAIADPPSLNTRLGRSFLEETLNGNKSRLPGGGEMAAAAVTGTATTATAGEGTAITAPVTMLEAAVCFIESSKSITPALVLSKFLQTYEEMARDLEGEPWASVHAWAEAPARQDWDIKSGVNFMQFVDCLGKLGLVAYKGSRYTEMLPTAADKMEHFLSAHLGLTDQRKWQRKVEAKLKKIKSVIKDVATGSPPRRPGSATGRKT